MSRREAVAVFGSSVTVAGSAEWQEAIQVGQRLGEEGLTVVTGGYGGIMEAVSRGASQVGGHVIGVIAPELFPGREGANPHVVETVEARTLTERIGVMVDRADGAIVMPGSIGTATEFLIAWNLNYLARMNAARPFPAVAVGESWRVVAATLASEIGAYPGDIHFAETSQQALGWILQALRIQ